MSFLPLVRAWIILAALASAAGWVLSALGQLNGLGYAVFAGLTMLAGYLSRRELMYGCGRFTSSRLRKRFSRWPPLAFAGLAALVLLGGVLYPPSNYDGLTYRLPRILHWLAEGRWHWIHTANYRMNDRSCGFEWLMTPLWLVTHSDRALFLLNFLPFLLLPGLTFSVFTRLGVNRRVAWQWMWLLPTGYNFLLQAGSLGNDAFAAVFILAGMDFALRAKTSGRAADAWFSLLAMALLTGAKPGNLPLLLPWLMVFWPVITSLFRKPLMSLGVAGVALLVSFLPTAILNSRYCGDWTGLTLENHGIAAQNPLAGIAGNSMMFLLANFVPTLFPWAGSWNQSALSMFPSRVAELLQANFEQNFHRLGEIPTEEWSGLGFGVSCLLAATILMARCRRSNGQSTAHAAPGTLVLVAPYVSLFYFFAKSGMMTVGRLVSAYYPLLLPLWLRGQGPANVVRQRWWRWATALVLLLAFIAVVLTPARPLWPAQTVCAAVSKANSGSALAKRIQDVYLVYATRSDPLAKAREALPDTCTVVGFAAGDNDPEISLWRPYGHRRVESILPDDTLSQIRARHIEYAVVGEVFLFMHQQTIQTWLAAHNATLLTSFTTTLAVSDGPRLWYVVRINTSPAPDGKAGSL